MRARSIRFPRRVPRRAAPVLAALLAAGCGSSHPSSDGALKPQGTFDTGGGPAPATASAPSAQPSGRMFETVILRYRAYQAAYKRVYEKNDPAELADVAVDPLLGQVTRDVEATKAKGEIWRFANTFNPRVYARSADSTRVYVIDCVRTLSAYRFSARTGARISGGPGSAYVYRTTVQYDSGTWKVADTVRDRPC
ncbi:hypothetical protein [Actinomadura roseirufa]|uniref:hypothetical protein n=1 Tax=Actinomadura roseirufa TaxID=2094049 RepID=UPI001040EC47|nr:hypothetical protein [Actinomadura roseirufa]